jgi:hypothetical protein
MGHICVEFDPPQGGMTCLVTIGYTCSAPGCSARYPTDPIHKPVSEDDHLPYPEGWFRAIDDNGPRCPIEYSYCPEHNPLAALMCGASDTG